MKRTLLIEEYLANCISRTLRAECAPSEFQARSRAIVDAIIIASEEGIGEAHKYLGVLVSQAEAGSFTESAESSGEGGGE